MKPVDNVMPLMGVAFFCTTSACIEEGVSLSCVKGALEQGERCCQIWTEVECTVCHAVYRITWPIDPQILQEVKVERKADV